MIEKRCVSMDPFSYPLDTKLLCRKKNRIKKELLAQPNLLHKKIAVLGGSTTNELADQLGLFLLHCGIDAEFYQSEYGQYWQDAVFGTPELDAFAPDIIYIHTNWRNVEEFPTVSDSIGEIDAKLSRAERKLKTMWETLSEKFRCPILQNNFDRPDYRLLGNRDIWDPHGRSNYISRLNQFLYCYAQAHSDFYINDLDFLAQDYGLSRWNDPICWNLYKYAFPMDAIPYVAQSAAFIIKAIYGKNKKALVLDLDNTLWGGVIGDDGVEGIQIGPETPQGQIYTEFQAYCKQLQQIGVLLAVNSKNEPENALAGLQHPSGVLKPEDFVDIKANWSPKDKNITEIAEELTLGADSFVFVDDNPAEREIVSAQVPGVAVVNADHVEDFIRALDHSGCFETVSLSGEDLKKTALYHAKAEAHKAEAAFSDYGAYLDSLEMTADIHDFDALSIPRVAQLTNKSNQFNLTTLRCTEDDIRNMQASPDTVCLCGRLTDKFADNGIVTVVSGHASEKSLHLTLWLMSCRVLKRGMEDAMLNALVLTARKRGLEKLVGYYYPTAKNGMVKDFYASMGFRKLSEDSSGGTVWELELSSYVPKPLHIRLLEQP